MKIERSSKHEQIIFRVCVYFSIEQRKKNLLQSTKSQQYQQQHLLFQVCRIPLHLFYRQRNTELYSDHGLRHTAHKHFTPIKKRMNNLKKKNNRESHLNWLQIKITKMAKNKI